MQKCLVLTPLPCHAALCEWCNIACVCVWGERELKLTSAGASPSLVENGKEILAKLLFGSVIESESDSVRLSLAPSVLSGFCEFFSL